MGITSIKLITIQNGTERKQSVSEPGLKFFRSGYSAQMPRQHVEGFYRVKSDTPLSYSHVLSTKSEGIKFAQPIELCSLIFYMSTVIGRV